MSSSQASEAKPRAGILGLGRRGRAIASRLAAQGHAIAGWTRSGVTPAAARELGITACADIAAVAARSDVILLSLSDDAAVTAVLQALVRADLAGKIVADTSTVSPDTLARQSEALRKAGAAVLDAPISGGPEMVLTGKAGFYIGGAAEDVARFAPVASALSNRVLHVGPLGAGMAAKVVNNMMLLGFWQSLKEALQLGKRAGLSLERMVEILSGSPAASAAFLHRAPVILGQSDAVGFSVSGVVKDGGVFEQVLIRHGVATPAISAAITSFRAHDAAGHGEEDLATMVRAAFDAA